MIRTATSADIVEITNIYNYYILKSVATFEEQEVTTEEMQLRINKVLTRFPWLIYEQDGIVHGYAYASPWKPRSAYRNTVESTVYVKPESFKKGIAQQLYTELIKRLKGLHLHAILAGITLPNAASVGLHEKFGFTKVGQLREVGFKFDRWVDVGYWQLILNSH